MKRVSPRCMCLKEWQKLQVIITAETSGPIKRQSWPTEMSVNDHSIFRHLIVMVLTSGMSKETEPLDTRVTAHPDTWKAAMKIMNTNSPNPEDGPMSPPIPLISGSPIILEAIGDPTGMDDGYGILFTAMCGIPMIPGDGTPIIMVDGTGVIIMDGTGCPDITGHRPG